MRKVQGVDRQDDHGTVKDIYNPVDQQRHI